MERKKIRSECNLLGLKIINYTTNVKYAKKRWLKPVYGLIKKFSSAYEFRKGDIMKRRFPYKYMDRWESFDKTSLSDKEDFRSELNLEDITVEDYAHTQKVWKKFKIKNLGECHDLYV